MPTSIAPSQGSQAASPVAQVAGSAPRVAPVSSTAPLQARSAGQPAPQAVPTPSATQSGANVARQVSAQLLQSMIQTLGKPLPGQVASPQSGLSSSAANQLSLQLTLPSGATSSVTGGQTPASGQPQSVSVRLPLPAGQTLPAVGTPVSVGSNGDGLTVSVRGPAPITTESLRADVAKQTSVAPAMADVARLTASPNPGGGSIDNALARLMGFTLGGDDPVSPQTLRGLLDGARVMPNPASATANIASPAGGSGPGSMQNALGALIRALGLSQPAQQPTGAQQQTGTASQTGPQHTPGGENSNPLPRDAGRPSKLPSIPLPLDAPDLSDPTQVQNLQRKLDGALSRLNLLQGLGAESQRGAEQGQSLRLDIPLLLGQEVAVLGLAIDQENEAGGADRERPNHWRFRFAFESQAHGGIEGLVAMRTPSLATPNSGDTEAGLGADPVQLDVAVWVTDEATLARLEASREVLAKALASHDLVLTSLTLAPSEDAPEPAEHGHDDSPHLVDRNS